MVAREVRFILFTSEETRSAVAEFLLRRTQNTRPIQVERVELELAANGAVVAQVHLLSRAGGALSQAFSNWRAATTSPESAIVTLESNELLASVLIHCRRVNIPISSRSAKRLELSSGCLVLAMSLNTSPGHTQPKIDGGMVVHSGNEAAFGASPFT